MNDPKEIISSLISRLGESIFDCKLLQFLHKIQNVIDLERALLIYTIVMVGVPTFDTDSKLKIILTNPFMHIVPINNTVIIVPKEFESYRLPKFMVSCAEHFLNSTMSFYYKDGKYIIIIDDKQYNVNSLDYFDRALVYEKSNYRAIHSQSCLTTFDEYIITEKDSEPHQTIDLSILPNCMTKSHKIANANNISSLHIFYQDNTTTLNASTFNDKTVSYTINCIDGYIELDNDFIRFVQ